MPVDLEKWIVRKKVFWSRIWEDLEIGYLDRDLLPLLIELNLRPYTYTLSSCSGRIILVDSVKPWARKGTNVIFKKHAPITHEELVRVTREPCAEALWLIVSGPIIHASTASLKEAGELLRVARRAGFKHSGVLSMHKVKGIIVEMLTGIKAIHIIKKGEEFITPVSELSKVVAVANELLEDAKEALKRLVNEVRSSRPERLDSFIIRDLQRKQHFSIF
ncbi:MAG: hypothetical protein RMI83_06845 [Desulfurococcaceae archaeon]|nr:hypothetical protein [Sulfolobales archaeon]MDW8170798.1 hypothetical protein [Desulfurococcaceae archaeon]